MDRSHLRSDARMLSEEIGVFSTEVWGILWIFIAIVLTIWFIYISGKPASSTATDVDDSDSMDMTV